MARIILRRAISGPVDIAGLRAEGERTMKAARHLVFIGLAEVVGRPKQLQITMEGRNVLEA